MNTSAVNSSALPSQYFWGECDNYDNGDGKSGRPSVGLLILISTYSFEFLVGAPINLWLICHILKKRSKTAGVPPADFFPLHVALNQLCYYLVLPSFLSNHYVWRSNSVLAVVTFLNALVIVMKPLLLCLVCVERYMAVVRPLNYQRFKARQCRWACVGLSWCIYFIIASIGLFARSSFTVCVTFIPVLVIDTFCSLSVLKTLRKPSPGDRNVIKTKEEDKGKTDKSGSGAVRTENGKQEQSQRRDGRKQKKVEKNTNSMKKKAFITIAIIQVVLMLNYLPFIITMLLTGLVSAHSQKCQYMTMALAAAASCSYLQPLLYLYKLRRLPCMTQNTKFNSQTSEK